MISEALTLLATFILVSEVTLEMNKFNVQAIAYVNNLRILPTQCVKFYSTYYRVF
jgi:hypothetical protein